MKVNDIITEEQIDEIDRRGFLKGVGAAALAGVSGNAIANEPIDISCTCKIGNHSPFKREFEIAGDSMKEVGGGSWSQQQKGIWKRTGLGGGYVFNLNNMTLVGYGHQDDVSCRCKKT